METRKVQVRVTRKETWWPEFEVPASMSDEEAERYINAEAPDEVYDEYNHKYTLDTDTYAEVMEHFVQQQQPLKGINLMTKSKTTPITPTDTVTISVADLTNVLELYNTIDSHVDNIIECLDVDLSALRDMRRLCHKVSTTFNFRPQMDVDGGAEYWSPKVLPSDDKAWFYKGNKQMPSYMLDEMDEYSDISNTIDAALWIGEDGDDITADLEDISNRIANGDLSHQIF